MKATILNLALRSEHDAVFARQRARQIAGLLGFDAQDQTRIATAVSELGRNALLRAGSGAIEFSLDTARSLLTIAVSDPSDRPLDPGGDAQTGGRAGIVAARRLMDEFDVQVTAQGTRIVLGKQLPRRAAPPSPERLALIADELGRQRPADPFDVILQQNDELLQALVEQRNQKAALTQANLELEETNRGVVALYAELDERADHLQRANEIKTRFLSNMTHEFRTPLNSILSLSRILLQRLDGDLTAEQEKQVRFIEKSAEALSELVNDLLDLGKVEAGKITVRPTRFSVDDLFSALRGMLRPMLGNTPVELVFDPPVGVPPLFTDESKVSQILRNFISNAIKYTERGEVRVAAQAGPGGDVVFTVSDTGIGIEREHQERIFQEYTQIESALQHRVKGTGLGLPLSRKLAELLGGSVSVQSEIGRGSTFTATIPAEWSGSIEVVDDGSISQQIDPARTPVLFIDDNAETLLIYERLLRGTNYQPIGARTLKEARACLRSVQPSAIVLDILLGNESSWGFITELRRSEPLASIPVIVVTVVENEKQALALGADAFHAKPIPREWLLETLATLTGGKPRQTLLVTDDDEVARYLMRGLLPRDSFHVIEAQSGYECLYYARNVRPRAIFLDLLMPGLDGFETLEQLKRDPDLEAIPVIVHTAKPLTDADRTRLQKATAILQKESASREAAQSGVLAALVAAGLYGDAAERESQRGDHA